jgi:hypothetical protein
VLLQLEVALLKHAPGRALALKLIVWVTSVLGVTVMYEGSSMVGHLPPTKGLVAAAQVRAVRHFGERLFLSYLPVQSYS